MSLRKIGLALAITGLLGTGQTNAALVAHYDFNESAGPTLNDGVGTAHGTTTNVSFVPSGAGVGGSGFGNAGVFDGSTSKVEFGEPSSFDLGTSDFTIAGWFKTPTNTLNQDRILFHNQSFSGGGWSFEIGRADRSRRGQVFFTVGGGSSGVFSGTQAFSNGRVDDNAWHWVAAVVSGPNVNLYVDGVLQTDTGVLAAGTSSATSPAGTIAAFAARPTITPLEGQIDEWSIFNHALSGTVSGSNVLTGGELFELWQVPEPSSAILAMLSIAMILTRKVSK